MCDLHLWREEEYDGGCYECVVEDNGLLRKENEKLRVTLEVAVRLLSVASCPNCDGSGVVMNPVMRPTGDQDSMGWEIGEVEFEPEQCQWCDEKEQVLAKLGDKEKDC